MTSYYNQAIYQAIIEPAMTHLHSLWFYVCQWSLHISVQYPFLLILVLGAGVESIAFYMGY